MGEEVLEVPAKAESNVSAFMGMLLSGGLSLLLAFMVFMIGVMHDNIEAERELKGLTHLFAVEAADIYAESCRNAHLLFLGNRFRPMSSPQMVDAENLGDAIALDADPALAAAMRAIHGSQAQVRTDLDTAYAFYLKKKSFTQNQIRRVNAALEEMRAATETILSEAVGSGCDAEAIATLSKKRADGAALEGQLAAHVEQLLPDLKLSESKFDLGIWSGKRSGLSFFLDIVNYGDAPVLITGVECSLKGSKVVSPGKDEVVGLEIKPDGQLRLRLEGSTQPTYPPGPIAETFALVTDCPGYERVTLPITGRVELVVLEDDKLKDLRIRRDTSVSVYLYNCTREELKVRAVSCSIPGVAVSLPQGDTAAAPGDAAFKVAVIQISFTKSEMKPGPFEGTLTIETDAPGYESIEYPVSGNVP